MNNLTISLLIHFLLSTIVSLGADSQNLDLARLEIKGYIYGFADINNDKLTDIICVDELKKNILVYKNIGQKKFKLINKDNPIYSEEELNFVISNLVLLDFNNDNQLDVLVMSSSNEKIKQTLLILSLFDDNLVIKKMELEGAYKVQPFVVDYKNNGRYDLIGHKNKEDYDKGKLSVWIKNIDENYKITELNNENCQLSEINYSAYIDLNGDCLSDILLSCTDKYQILTIDQELNGKYDTNYVEINKEHQPQMVNVLDFDNNGLADLMYLSCKTTEGCSINILYNTKKNTKRRIPFTTSVYSDASICEPSDVSYDKDTMVTIKLKDILGSSNKYSKFTNLATDTNNYPLNVRLFDVDFDGLMDLVLTVTDKSTQKAIVLNGVPCSKNTCTAEQTAAYYITYELNQKLSDAINDHLDEKQLLTVFPFDFDNTGASELIVQSKDLQLFATSPLIKQQGYNMNYFIKVYGIPD